MDVEALNTSTKLFQKYPTKGVEINAKIYV